MKKLILFFTLVLSTLFASAQPLTVVVPYPPGGDTDILARLFASKYTEKTGKVVVVENRPGAAGVIGFMHISKAPADGTVIGLVPSTLATAPFFNPNAKYDAKTDFTPIMQLSGHGMFLAVNSNTGIKNVKDLVAANKDKKVLSYGTPGVASPQNVLGEMFNKEAGTDIRHVPFKGNADIINNMLNNTIPMSWNTMLPFIPHVESGVINIIAIASSKRSPLYPNVPTLKEQGYDGIEFESWLGFVGPKDMDKAEAAHLNHILNDIIKQPDVQDRLKKLAMLPIGSTPEHFKDRISKDVEKFRKISKDLNIKVE